MRSRFKILIIDDDAATRELLSDLFSPRYSVTTESNAIDALQDLECKQFDLLILDLGLPGLSGDEALARIRALPICPDLSILVISAYSGLSQRVLESGVQVDVILPKPFSLDEVERTVDGLLQQHLGRTRVDLKELSNCAP